MYPQCALCQASFTSPDEPGPVALKRCGHVLCQDCLQRTIASPTPSCPFGRCNNNRALSADDGLPLVFSFRQANVDHDVPFSIVKTTSEVHRARLRTEEHLVEARAELALLSDCIAELVSKIGFRDRCIASDRAISTSMRYQAAELQNKLRSSLAATT